MGLNAFADLVHGAALAAGLRKNFIAASGKPTAKNDTTTLALLMQMEETITSSTIFNRTRHNFEEAMGGND
jgi:hypothetical protein